MSCFSVKTYEKSPSFFEKQIIRGFARRIGEYIHIGGMIGIIDLNRHLSLIGISGEFDRYIRSKLLKILK